MIIDRPTARFVAELARYPDMINRLLGLAPARRRLRGLSATPRTRRDHRTLQHPSSRRACPKDLRRRHPRQPRPTPPSDDLGDAAPTHQAEAPGPPGHPRAVRASCCRRAFPPRKTNRYFMHYVDSALDPAAEDRLAAWLDREPQTASVLTLRTGFYSVAALEVMQERVDHFDVDKLKEINVAIEPRCSGQRLRR